MNKDCEVSLNELDEVTGGALIDFILGWVVGKVGDAIVSGIVNGDGHTPTNVLNAVLNKMGRAPV